MTDERFYVDKDGDLYDRKTNSLLMLNFGYFEYKYAQPVLDLLNEQDKRIQELENDNDDFSFNYTENYTEIDGNTLEVTDKHTQIEMDGKMIHITITPPNYEPYAFVYYITGIRFTQDVFTERDIE